MAIMNKVTPYLVIRDTQEKVGFWDYHKSGDCLGTVVEHLKTGDYTLRGMEELFVIERKRTTGELATNITEERFKRELERMESFRWPFLICQFNFEDLIRFPEGSGIPKDKWGRLRVTPKFLVKCVNQILVKYRTKIIFAGDHGKQAAESLFRRILENNAAGC